MQYIMLIYVNQDRWAELSTDEKNRVHADCGAWHQELVKSGQSVGATGLQPATASTSVRSQDGRILITDGPFAETKEVLGGFETVECQDLDEALAIARRFPGLGRGGSVEVRPTVTGGECRD